MNYALFLALEIKHLISQKSVDLLVIILEKCARSLRVNYQDTFTVQCYDITLIIYRILSSSPVVVTTNSVI